MPGTCVSMSMFVSVCPYQTNTQKSIAFDPTPTDQTSETAGYQKTFIPIKLGMLDLGPAALFRSQFPSPLSHEIPQIDALQRP